MAFDIYAAQGYGSGSADVVNPADTLNAYAKVTALNGNSITVDDASAFNVGGELFLHDTSPGRWLIATITAKVGNVLSLNKNVLWQTLPAYLQAVTVPHFKTLTIESGHSISPPAFLNGKGGIIVFKCSEALTLGGAINLVDKGIAPADKSIRSYVSHEDSGVEDTSPFSGYENAVMPYYVPLNAGDGLAFIITKKLIKTGSGRIGNPDNKCQGAAYCRGANHPSRPYATNVGGSTILLVAETLQGYSPQLLAKYRDKDKTQGKGLARCYVASNTVLNNDEALYSYDIISDPSRLKTNCNINGFGYGSANKSNPSADVNSFARVVAIDDKTITYADKTDDNDWTNGLVMIHFKNKSTTYTEYNGRFRLSKVVADDGNRLTLKDAPPAVSLKHYSAQVIRIPQYLNFTLNASYDKTRPFNGKTGGIFAVAVKDTCDLRGGVLDMSDKGGNVSAGQPVGAPYNVDNKPLTFGNVYNHSRLPLGEGHGSIFILAKTLKLDQSSRLGAPYPGNAFGGKNGDSLSGGWQGAGDELAGSGKGGGHVNDFVDGYGGYGCSSYHYDGAGKRLLYGRQGAHVFIVADTIDGLSLANISTGGAGSGDGQPGGAGYGGGAGDSGHVGGSGGYLGGGVESSGFMGGGGAGSAFLYVNNVTNQDTSDII